MPRIPLAPRVQNLPTGGAAPSASLAAAAAPGQAIAEAGADVANAAFAFEAERQERQLADLQTRATLDIAGFEEELANDPQPETYERRLSERMRDWRAQNLRGLTPNQAERFEPIMQQLEIGAGRRTRQAARRRQVDVSRAQLAENLDAVASQYARAEDMQMRQQLADTAVNAIEQRVASGVLTAEQGQEQIADLRTDLGEIDARAAIAEDPKAFLQALDDERAFPMLQGERRQIWAERAQKQSDAVDRQMERAEAAAERERDKVEKQLNADLYAITDLEVSRGLIGYPEVQRLVTEGNEAGVKLSVRQGVDLFKRIDNRFEQQAEDQQSIARVATILAEDGLPLDPRNRDDQNAAELYWTSVARPELANADPETYNARAADFVARAGIVPNAMAGRVRSGLISNDVEQINQASGLIRRLEGLPSGALQRSFNQKDIALGLQIADLVDAGIAPGEAARRAREIVDPDNTAVMNERRAALAEAAPESDYENWITDFFDTVWSFEPELPRTGGVRARVIDEFGDAYESWFLLTGDETRARSLALEDIGQVWGVTEVSGRFATAGDPVFGDPVGPRAESTRRIMKYPPERVYGFPGADNSWISEQLVADVQGMGAANVQSLDDVFLVSDSVTAREFSTGSPTYVVMVKDENGVFVRPRDDSGNLLRWRPDLTPQIEEMDEAQRKRQEQIIRNQNESRSRWNARKQQMLLLGTSPSMEITGGGS
ncbi:MAG: hypothetical protein QNJ92_06900 [Alphaproteobacteria bacterium]|nr:hypothetical protein [Alphaproteobacteria bacterium]